MIGLDAASQKLTAAANALDAAVDEAGEAMVDATWEMLMLRAIAKAARDLLENGLRPPFDDQARDTLRRALERLDV